MKNTTKWLKRNKVFLEALTLVLKVLIDALKFFLLVSTLR